MSFEIKDLAGLSEPCKKLIDVISAGIGSVFRPRSIRNEADARAYEIRTIAAASADASICQANAEIAISSRRALTLEPLGIPERARLRLETREIEGQQNLEAIADTAFGEMPSKASDAPVSADWRRKFFLEAENICDADLQHLWGKVLAGEVTTPGSYSLRTLDVLKQMSRVEAETFRSACNLAFRDGWILWQGNDINTELAPFGLNYSSLMRLREAGMLHEGDMLHKNFTVVGSALPVTMLENNGVFLELSGESLRSVRLPSLSFTQAGRELQNLMEPNPSLGFIEKQVDYFRARGLTVRQGRRDSSGLTIVFSETE